MPSELQFKHMFPYSCILKPIILQKPYGMMVVVFPDFMFIKFNKILFDSIAAEWTAFGCFWTNGQICSATSRLIVHVSCLMILLVLSLYGSKICFHNVIFTFGSILGRGVVVVIGNKVVYTIQPRGAP